MAPGVLSYSSSGTSPSASPVMMTPIDHSDTTSDGFTSLSVGPLDGVGLNIHGQSTNGHSNGHSNGSASAHATSQGYTNPVGGSDAGLKQMPIAIVGMACRMPGSVSSPAEFWELCSRARTGFTPVPKERFNHEAFYHPNPGKTGAYHAEGGNFLDVDLASFDAPFFGLTEKEAISMDPQQRLLLECTFEALENAGIPKHTIVGKDVGVFVGGSFAEYESHLFRDSDTIPMHQATGCAHAMQSNRLSHFFDLRGPSFTADTACSASLVALHLACQSLRAGESTSAIVGGCHLNMLPEFWISFSSCRLLADSGRSIAFDQRGTGFGRGEGCGMIILKPLDQAIRDNDSIRAVIRGTGINQDGKTPGITMPSGAAQEKLMRQIYRNAGLDPNDCGYVEAHGTGTKVGDPIEATAIHNVIGQNRSTKDPLFIGSVKSNIGHLEAASGIAGVIKATMMLERGFLLPNHDFKKPNEKIPWKEWNMKVPATQRPFPKNKKYISVNNFGFGGTNAHVVLEKAPHTGAPKKDNKNLPPPDNKKAKSTKKIYVLSANDKNSVGAVMKNLVVYLEQRPEIFQNDLMDNIAYTLGSRRSMLPWRVAIPATDSFELIETLNSGKVIPGKETEPLRIGFVFTGQGAQWWGMGRELYGQYPIYTAAIDRADECLRKLGAEWSLVEELSKDQESSKVSEAHISQPACSAVQLALTDLLRTWGIRPAAVAGHSSGEIGAAYAAGIIGFEAAMAIAYHRGRLIPILKQRNPDLQGSMMAVGGTKEEVQPMIDALKQQQVRIACYNSPSSLTISGDSAALGELEKNLEDKQMFNRRLQVETAYHSHHMNLVAKEYRESISELPHPQTTDVRFHSSLYGHQIDGFECQAHYWVNNLTCPVRFSEALETMLEPVGEHKTGVNMIIELGPHSALQGPIKQILKHVGEAAMKVPYASPLVRKKDAVESAMDLACNLITKGAILNMDNVNFPNLKKKPSLLTDLPRYAWNYQNKYWQESRMTQMHKYRKSPRNDLIGLEAIYSSDLEPTWRNIVHLDDLPWLRHHAIQSVTIFPISAFIGMALEASAQWAQRKEISFEKYELRDVSVVKPLALQDADVEMTINLRPHQETNLTASETWKEFRICSWSHGSGWTEHCVGLIALHGTETNEVDGKEQKLAALRGAEATMKASEGPEAVAVAENDMYERLTELGVGYGPSFQCIKDCKASNKYSTGTISSFDVAADMPNHYQTSSVLHPTFLESVIEMYWPILGAGRTDINTVYLPSSIGRMSISRDITALTKEVGSALKVYCKADFPAEARSTKVSVFATSEANDLVIEIDELTVSPIIDGETELASNPARELCYKLEWEEIGTLKSLSGKSKTKINGASGVEVDAPLPDVDVAIIHGDSNSQQMLANGLAIALASATSRLPEMGTMHEVNTEGKLTVVLTEIEQPFLANPTKEQFAEVRGMLAGVQGCLWVVRGAYDKATSPESNMIIGLSRTVRSETVLPFATLDLDDNNQLDEDDSAAAIFEIFKLAFGASASSTSELEFMERSGKLSTPRIVHDEDMNEFVHRETNPSVVEMQPFGKDKRCLKMEFSTPGAIETVHFVDDIVATQPLGENEIEFDVKAVGMNLRDVMIAKGQIPEADKHALGVEASGIVTRVGSAVRAHKAGDRIAALTISHGAYATRTRTTAANVMAMPSNMSFEDASTLPLAYCTAYYSLVEQARLREGQRILVHSAGGGIGQASVCLAKMIGAEIFVTVSTAAKKKLLMQHYNVPEDHIFYSRNTTWRAAVRRATNDEGVDVVLNTLPGADALRESWACLSRFGCLVDVRRKDGSRATRLDMGQSDSNASFLSVDIFGLAAERPKIMERLVADVSKLLADDQLRPIDPATVFPVSCMETAFKTLQTTQGPGKLVVVPHAEDVVMATPSKAAKALLKHDATYLLIGGTGGLGRSMSRWMVAHGARNLVLLSRSGSATGKVKELIDEAANDGAHITVRPCNVADKSSVEQLFNTGLKGLPPVRGVIHGAMVLRDVLFEQMTYNDYTSVTESKVQGAWNFHNALQERQTELDFFIAISSAAGAVGNRGQAAYAAANCFLNAFVQHRLALGLPATSLDLTAVSDAGYLADGSAERAAEVAKNLGSDSICEAEVLALIGASISNKTSVCNHHVITGMRITPSIQPFWTPDAKFKALRLAAEELAAAEAGANGAVSLNAALKASRSETEAMEVVCRGLVEKIAAVLMMEIEDLDVTRSLSHYPLDSLVAIEIRNFITREFEANMQVLELLSSGSIQTLTKAVCKKSKLCVGFDWSN
ncbi:beta-ketoacyl synthase domain-containing protein [Colletotrichum lupini]|uniref:Beta-ketoacyl synthase domain-containing protein n=1 Tax=Colletotrichum lupini TaxID=145971 RepID=A0A9Q8SWM6_9PEZI|nr:beta-ketoacyl synthase domain-containing protein [Colletotrichum lupini]UQC84889.1 beta-ketoacyl synthase domain-containing protein [Colletotrichum lupini]